MLLLSEDPFEVKAELSSPAARVGGGAVYSLAFNPLKSSPLLLAGSQHCGALLWDVTRPQSPAVAIQLPSAAAAGGDAVSAACFHPTDPNLLYVTLRHGRKLVKVDLRLPTGGGEVGSALMPSLSHEPTCLAAHGEGALLAVGTSSGGVALYGTDLVLEKMLQCGGVGGRQAFPPPVTDLAWQSRRASLSSSKKGSTGGGSVVGGSISSGSPRAAPSESPNAAAAATGSPTRMMGGAPTTAASLPASSAAAAALAVPQTGSSILASTSLAAAVAAVRPPTANAATATAAASVRPSSNEAPSTSGLTAAAAAATRPSAAAPLAAAGSPAGATSSTAAAATGAPAAAQQLSQMQMTQLQSDIQRSVHAAVAAAVGSGSAAAVATTSSGGPALDRAVAVAVRSALDGFAEEVRSRLLDVHMEVIRQAHDTGAQLMSAIGGVAARQDRLEAEQAALREQIAMLLRRADIVRRL